MLVLKLTITAFTSNQFIFSDIMTELT